jgi:hypothetical protein
MQQRSFLVTVRLIARGSAAEEVAAHMIKDQH